ncbi:MAG: hypothetical protein C0501_11650 [Isosphaera sp.]|nr:hypothetical protein [Isosphaera sp.]
MADTTVDSREPRDLAPDLVGVKSRVSWGAILAGAVIGLATLIVLSLFFGAIGVSLADAGVKGSNVGVGVLIALFVSVIASMFLAGWVASQMTVGENRQEAALYGLLTWATVAALSMALVGAGVRAGYFAVVGGGLMAQNSNMSAADAARQLGMTEQQINEARARLSLPALRDAANDPANQEAAQNAAVWSSWTALVALMLSMGACVGGSCVGRGMAFRLFPVAAARRDPATRLIVPTA